MRLRVHTRVRTRVPYSPVPVPVLTIPSSCCKWWMGADGIFKFLRYNSIEHKKNIVHLFLLHGCLCTGCVCRVGKVQRCLSTRRRCKFARKDTHHLRSSFWPQRLQVRPAIFRCTTCDRNWRIFQVYCCNGLSILHVLQLFDDCRSCLCRLCSARRFFVPSVSARTPMVARQHPLRRRTRRDVWRWYQLDRWVPF